MCLQAGMIPLHLAINVGNFDVVQELLQCHIPEQLNAITVDYQDCALHLAARRSDLDVVQFLIDNGAIVNQHNVCAFVRLFVCLLFFQVRCILNWMECVIITRFLTSRWSCGGSLWRGHWIDVSNRAIEWEPNIVWHNNVCPSTRFDWHLGNFKRILHAFLNRKNFSRI